MKLFENGGTCGDYLKRAYSFLVICKTTSDESKQAFSFAVLFSTKIRKRLGALCFLISFFKTTKIVYFLISKRNLFCYPAMNCLSFNKYIFFI